MPKAKESYSYVEEWRSQWSAELKAIAYNGITCDPTRVDPKVLDWVKEQCMDKPHFVKIINPNAAKGRPGLLDKNACSISVPTPFVREHFRQLQRVVTLENSNSMQDGGSGSGSGRKVCKWRVSFGSCTTRDPQWLQGWVRVARDNNFLPGDVVVFVLVEASRFQFTHFDAGGNLITPSAVTTRVKPGRGCSSQESHDQAQSSDRAVKWVLKKTRLVEELTDAPMSTVSNLKDAVAKETKKRALVELANGPLSTVIHVADVATKEMRKRALVALASSRERINEVLSVSNGDDPATKQTKMRALVELANGPMPLKLGEELVALPIKSNPAGTPMAEPSRKEQRLRRIPNPASVIEPKSGNGNIVAVQKRVDESFNPFEFEIKSKRREVTLVERQRAKDAAMAHAHSLTPVPYFVAVMSEAQVYRNFHLVVPEGFVAESGLTATTAATTQVVLDDGGTEIWNMLVMRNKFNEVAFSRKLWALFALQHLLEDGDVCVFHLLQPPHEHDDHASASASASSSKSDPFSLLVYLFRVVPLPAHPVSIHHHFTFLPLRTHF